MYKRREEEQEESIGNNESLEIEEIFSAFEPSEHI
jgi:hypothetical protein